MVLLELAVIVILAVYYRFRILNHPERKSLLFRLLLLAAAAWTAEETCILFYRFYSYSPKWSLFLLDVPAPIVLIWPAVIFSARDIGVRLARGKPNLAPLIAAGVVWTDASLIEPVSVHAGLWVWNRPGVLEVPLIGIFGWAYFAFLSVLIFDLGGEKNRPPAFDCLRPLAVAAGTHALLVCSWWGAFKWMQTPVDQSFAVASAWSVSLFLSCLLFRLKAARRIEKKILLQRLPASLFIFGLLASAETDRFIWAYAAAFILPYLTLMVQQYALSHSPDHKSCASIG